MPQSSSMQQRFFVWLSDNPGEAILRGIFIGVVTVTIAALAVDLAGMNGWGANPAPAATPAEIRQDSRALDLPSFVPSILAPLLPGGDKRLLPLPPPDGAMAKPMTFELVSGGKLMATGTITPGISEAFAAEVSRHGEYIKTVVLSSPGGSVADALTMGRTQHHGDRKSTRLNSSHTVISYAVFCLKKKILGYAYHCPPQTPHCRPTRSRLRCYAV